MESIITINHMLVLSTAGCFLYSHDKLNRMIASTLLKTYFLQLRQQNEERHGNMNVEWAPNIQHRPQAMSSPNETSHFVDSSNFLPAVPVEPQLDDAVLDIIHGQQNLVRPTDIPRPHSKYKFVPLFN
jgi:hypothetical protein